MRYEAFRKELKGWYQENRRDLPWRRTTDPYRIWLSEIILQQTRVEQGLPYYNRFLAAFPDVKTLASAAQDEVLKEWQGLGYYSRARNLHAAAQQVAFELKGRFPTSYDGLLSLKGVGPYTAAAIGSIAYGLPNAVVDGNVNRVVARLFDIDKPINSTEGVKEVSHLADLMLDKQDAGNHNQAMMELGATVCTPKKVGCDLCPVQSHCMAYANNRVELLPVKLKKVKIKERFITYFISLSKDGILMRKRGAGDIWQGLYDFPSIEIPFSPDQSGALDEALNIALEKDEFSARVISKTYKHQLTHRTIYARFVVLKDPLIKPFEGEYIPLDDVNNYAVPRLIERYLHDTDLLSL